MAVHVASSLEAQIEARVLMMSVNNLLSACKRKADYSADARHGPRYLLSNQDEKGVAGEGRFYADAEDVSIAYDAGAIDVHAMVKVKLDGNLSRLRSDDAFQRDMCRRMFPLQ